MGDAIGTAVLGGGLAGLAAGSVLSRAGRPVTVVEAGAAVGGLARTVEHEGFRFDLGGHRFLTRDAAIGRFVADLLGNELLDVPRSSKILLRGKYFDYPLRPANAVFGLGVPDIIRILTDYGRVRLADAFCTREPVSLEDWVVQRFGRTMFDLYFRDYSEKVWGIPSDRVSAEWVAQRIAGLSLGKAVKNAFSRRSGREISTLADRFYYPRRGIGQISASLQRMIEERNRILTGTAVLRIRHDGAAVQSIMVRSGREISDMSADVYVSSLPLTTLVRGLSPPPPARVLRAVSRLRFRDLVVVAVMLDRPQVTDLSWLYLPEKQTPIGRIHEPRNWSASMAPFGKTHLVAEYFCFRGDDLWCASDDALAALTVREMERLGLIVRSDVIGSCAVRVPGAYPLLATGYREHHGCIVDYLSGFRNLQLIGRGGTFQYLNMDHAIASGIRAAEHIVNGSDGQCEEQPCGLGSTRMNTDAVVGSTS